MRMFLKRIHFIGIGGAGMSPLAEIANTWGLSVSGSDRQASAVTRRLESLGIRIQYTHQPDLVREAELVVYSSAIKAENAELAFARGQGCAVMRRAEVLGDLMRSRFSIAVAGTHGKTTTTALTGHLFSQAGQDPTIIVGGTLCERNSNAVIGAGNVLIAEADEFDRSFLAMYPSIAIITNIDADHLDCYRDLDEIREAFVQFSGRVPFYGTVILCQDDAGAAGIAARIDRHVITYGIDGDAHYRAADIRATSASTIFSVVRQGLSLGEIEMPLVGLHNVRNALAGIAAAMEMGIGFETIQASLSSFGGVKRRFEIIGSEGGVAVVDDYAHHPREIAATLAAARLRGYGRVIAVFQPHLYSRTRDFMDGFVSSLSAADLLFVSEIYQSREEPLPGVSGAEIVARVKQQGGAAAFFLPRKEQIVDAIVPLLRQGDAVILMGAGDINEIAHPLLERIRHG